MFNIGQIQSLPVTAVDVRKTTRTDRVLSRVYQYTQNSWPWPASVPEYLQPFKSRQDEIGVEDGCLMWGVRVIIPAALQSTVLKSLHSGHPGITCMKAIARSYFWWPGLDRHIEELAISCDSCQRVKSSPTVTPLHPWVWPDAPWKRLHVDFASPFLGKTFLIHVDAHSKWPEVIPMPSTTYQSTIDVLCSLFSRYGLPEQLVFAISHYCYFWHCTIHMPCTFFLIMYSNHCDKISDIYKIIHNIYSHKIYASLQY